MKKGMMSIWKRLSSFPDEKNVAFIHYTEKNTRINKITRSTLPSIGCGLSLRQKTQVTTVICSCTSRCRNIVRRNRRSQVGRCLRGVQQAHARREHSGRLENLIDILEQLSSSLRLFSETFFSFRSDVQSIFKHEHILIRSFQTYHTMKFDAKAVALSNTKVGVGLRDKFAANTWPFLAIEDPKSKGGDEHERIQLIYRSCENSLGLLWRSFGNAHIVERSISEVLFHDERRCGQILRSKQEDEEN